VVLVRGMTDSCAAAGILCQCNNRQVRYCDKCEL